MSKKDVYYIRQLNPDRSVTWMMRLGKDGVPIMINGEGQRYLEIGFNVGIHKSMDILKNTKIPPVKGH
jgi:hypothetical protein